ncbi:prolyl oligopeptidase family serine peptidase [uncultured Maribacter sp.]|uniref:prolyl oligopeptidase family serine peptidase n=1 Tax=uncultured Maribacter sp. TaxID=431308 RepID=UPI0030EB3C91
MRLFFTSHLVLFLISSCSSQKTIIDQYPLPENNKELVKEHGLEYLNIYANLENINSPETKDWLSKQDTIVHNYYANNGFEEYSKQLDYVNKTFNPGYYWLKNSDDAYYYWGDNDSTQVLYRRYRITNELKPIYSATYDKTVHFYQPNKEGTMFILFVSDDEGDYLQVIDIASQKILFETAKDMNSQQVSYAVWANQKQIVFTGWPNPDNSKNSYLALGDISTGSIKKIFSGDDIMGYNEEHFLRPNIRYGSDVLQAILVSGSESYNGFNTSMKTVGSNNPSWKQVMFEKDSVLYYPKERNGDMYFLRYKNGQKNLIKTTIDNISDPSKDNVIFRPEEDYIITSYAVSNTNIYVITSKYGIEHKAYAINKNNDVTLLELDYPATGLRFYSHDSSLGTITLLQSSWKENYVFIDVDDSLNITVNDEVTRKTPQEFKNIRTEIIEVISYDGTMVPMTIIKPNNFVSTNAKKAIITVYGSYGISIESYYSMAILDFVKQGNVFAIAHVRGGSEKGLKWYTDAIKENKKHSWKDLLACSQYLKDNGYTDKDKLGVYFSSAGGVTAGMAINEDPEMYKASVGEIPLLNPLRLGYQKNFNASDNDYDFGTKSTLEGLNSLLSLDPVYNLQENRLYPNTLIINGEIDELIPVYDGAKYIAFLQNQSVNSDRTFLLDVIKDGGHGLDTDVATQKAMFFFNKEL